MAALLTTSSTLQCSHGGSVTIASSNTKVQATSALALMSDTFTVAGCSFQIPIGTGTVAHPCVRVQWTKPNMRTTVDGTPTLAQDSVGLCLAADQAPQGAVTVVQTQMRADGT